MLNFVTFLETGILDSFTSHFPDQILLLDFCWNSSKDKIRKVKGNEKGKNSQH